MTNDEVMEVAQVLGPVLQQEIENLRVQVGEALAEHAEAIQAIQVLLNTEATRRLVVKMARDLDVKPSDLVGRKVDQ